MALTKQTRRYPGTQFLVLALSTFLLGLYFGRELPSGVDLITLQTGLIGIMAFLSLSQVTRLSRLATTAVRTANHVERRLQRFVDNQGRIHRFDDAETCHIHRPMSPATESSLATSGI